MGALRKRAQRTEADGHLRVAHRRTAVSYWKFYLDYTVYELPSAHLADLGGVPQAVLEQLSFGERRMLHYLVGLKGHPGCCYVKQHGVPTQRFLALQKLARSGIVKLKYLDDNIIYFGLADQFSKQQKFNIHDGRYTAGAEVKTTVNSKPGFFLKIVQGVF